jgi:putative IMPACT (imprinted ancient) family translation regulator
LLAGGHSAAVDDGEPSGTAGRPMLDVLRHQNLDGVLATVVRYFGGVKLGAGGLVRAYTDCIAQALKEAEKIPVVRQQALTFSVPYALEGLARRVVEGAGGQFIDVQHAELVSFVCTVAQPEADRLVALLNESGQGKLVWIE